MTRLIHEKYKTPEIVALIEQLNTVLTEYDSAGGDTYHSYQQPRILAVNVKSNVNVEVPEFITEPDDIRFTEESRLFMIEEWEREDFWNDMSVEEDTYLEEINFPTIGGAGASGGYLTFGRNADEFNVYANLFSNWSGGNSEEAMVEFIEEYDCHSSDYTEFDEDDEPEYIQQMIDEINTALDAAVSFFKEATKWVKHVKGCQTYREANLQGKHREWLDNQISNARYELFDLQHCTAVIDGEEMTVSWPQHARIFADATSLKKVFEFGMPLTDFVDALEPGIAIARKALSKEN